MEETVTDRRSAGKKTAGKGCKAMNVQKNNKGFSLVEILVVLVIMVVLTSGAVVAFTNWRSWNLDDCVKKLDTGLSSAKVEAMGKEKGELIIHRSSDGTYKMEVTGEEEETIGDEDIRIYYTDSAGNTDVLVTDSKTLTLSYSRATGAFKEISTDASGNKVYCKSIRIERKNLERNIILVKSTGSHYIED